MSDRFERAASCDPCEGVQVDISAMLDQELDDARANRVLVHIEVCSRCRTFLLSLQTQLELHRKLDEGRPLEPQGIDGVEGPGSGLGSEVERLLDDDFVPSSLDFSESEPEGDPLGVFSDGATDSCLPCDEAQSPFLQKMLAEGLDRLAGVFYQLGRAYVLLTVSPEFFRVLCREPVPIPEYRLRGKALIDGLSGSDQQGQRLEASLLLDGELDSMTTNLEKARSLLGESLRLRPVFAAAQIMLGQCYMQRVDWQAARRCFQRVLADARHHGDELDPGTTVPLRVYALEHLGNLCLAEGRPGMALRYFRMVAASGAIDMHPNFCSALLNEGYVLLRLGRRDEAAQCFETLYARFPAKREAIARMLNLKVDLQRLVLGSEQDAPEDHPSLGRRLAASCPLWFGRRAPRLVHGDEVRFQALTDDPPRRPSDSGVPLSFPQDSATGPGEPNSDGSIAGGPSVAEGGL